VSLSWRLDRVDRVQAALLAERIAAGPIEEEQHRREEVEELGRRLWSASPRPLSGDDLGIPPAIPKSPDDRDDPARLVNRLEATADGCRWLLDRWAALREVVDAGLAWPTAEMVWAIRLLSKQPLDAPDDPQVLAIILACSAMDPDRPDPFAALWETLTTREVEYYRERLLGRGLADATPRTKEHARELLLDIVDEAVEPLEELEAQWREREAALAAARTECQLYDDSPEGEWLRRQQGKSTRAILRIVGRLREARRRGVELGADRPAPPSSECGSPPLEEPIDRQDASGRGQEGTDGRGPEVPKVCVPDLSRLCDPVTSADAGPASDECLPTPSMPGPKLLRSGARAVRTGRRASRLIRLLGSLSLLLPFLTAIRVTEWSPPSNRPEVSAHSIHTGDGDGAWDHRVSGLPDRDSLAAPLETAFEPRNRQNEPKFARVSPVFRVRQPRPERSADRSRSPP
jgi:hypothetical protein